tara:strand:+ start:1381 stop:1758 length:378 start_codon:yes stop_codon:yes gene_type:complete
MTDIILDSATHDILLVNGSPQLHNLKKSALGQRLKIALLLRRSEWAPNINLGVPYQSQIFQLKNNKAFVDSYFETYIANVEGVDAVVAYSSEVTRGRQLIINFTVRTTSGEIVTIDIGEDDAINI